MTAFTVDAARALGGPDWLVAAPASPRPSGSPTIAWPTPSEEIWRYSRIGELDLDALPAVRPKELGRAGDERAPGGGPWAAEAGSHAA